MIRAALRSLLTLALLVGVGACDGGEIVVFSAVAQAGSAASEAMAASGGSAGDHGLGGSLGVAGGSGAAMTGAAGGDLVDKPCQTTDDCDPAWLCQKQDCSEPGGVCLPRPVSDDAAREPVCGCDHITYWNDTLRQQYGITASAAGECKSGARTCISNDDCGSYASCAHLLFNMSSCGMPGTGTCWITPNDCLATDDKPHWLPCAPPGDPSGPPPPCLTTCEAVQSGRPHSMLPHDAACP
ncbi:MAG: hypothetical protein WDO69_01610 [Pseudomonadota bacterium]